MNTDLMFSSATDEWSTPLDLFAALDAEFHFGLDVAATAQNAKTPLYYDRESDGLARPWLSADPAAAVWCNPPYGRQIGKWVQRGWEQAQEHGATIVMLLPARTDTQWFQSYCVKGEVRFLPGRLRFGGAKNAAPFPSMIVVFRPIISDLLATLGKGRMRAWRWQP